MSGIFLTTIGCIAGEKEKTAVSEAEAWLALVDDGKYQDSWKGASGSFRNAVRMMQWDHTMKSVRKPLGKILKRGLKSATYKTSLPGVPDGEYVVVQYSTSFENKKSAIETIIPMVDSDGGWRVSGYFIK